MAETPRLQDSDSQVLANRLSFPKDTPFNFFYSALIAGNVTNQEFFLNGVANKRLRIPVDSAVHLFIQYTTFEYTTATGAFVAGGGGFLHVAATNNNGTVAMVTNTTAVADPIPDTPVAAISVVADDPNDSVILRATTATAGSTYKINAIVNICVANKLETIAGRVV